MQTDELLISSAAFENKGFIPVEYTGYGIDQSPPLSVEGISPQAKSLALIMVDHDHPLVRDYTHWLIWNLPVRSDIPGAIPWGDEAPGLEGARQGMAYGRHRYRGPKPPRLIRKRHRYIFTVYALDTVLDLESKAGKKELLQAMSGHILQRGELMGQYQNAR